MRIALFGVLQALPTFFAFITATVESSRPAGGDCEYIINTPFELTWSTEHNLFVTSSPEFIPQTGNEYENASVTRNVWCVTAPDGHRIVLRLTARKGTEWRKPDCNSTTTCESSCLTVYEKDTADNETSLLPSNLTEVLINFFKMNNMSHNLPLGNSSKVKAGNERYPRQTILSSKKELLLPPMVSVGSRSRRKNREKCKKCKKKRNARRRERKRFDDIAAKMLREIYKTAQRISVKNARSISKALERNKAFMAFYRRLPIHSGRRRKLPSPRSTRRTSSSNYENPQNDDLDPSVVPPFNSSLPPLIEDAHERGKRQANHITSSPPNERFQPLYSLCESDLNPRVSLINSSAQNEAANSTESNLLLRSKGSYMRLNLESGLLENDTLLHYFVINITFEPRPESSALPEVQAGYDTVGTTPVVWNRTSFATRGSTKPSQSLSPSVHDMRPSLEPNVAVVVCAALGSLVFLVILTVSCVCFVCRTKRSNSGKTRRDFNDEAESEKCLAVDACEEQLSYSSSKDAIGRVDQTTVQESEIRMLEHKKHPKRGHNETGKTARQDTTARDNRTRDSSRHHQRRQNRHVSKCKHAQTAGGSSRHDLCIVCQIAGKPHQPIMDAQYATEFLPPASRTHTGCNSALPNPHDNFDKYNRMQNNPYRHSPSLSPKTASLPWTVRLPDGEERYRVRHDAKPTTTTDDKSYPVCIKPAPNRTIFGRDTLPFTTADEHRKLRPNGYPGPPTSSSNAHTVRDCNSNHRTARTPQENRRCICRYILNHIDEPPPEYSDVIKQETPPCEAENAVCILETTNNENLNSSSDA